MDDPDDLDLDSLAELDDFESIMNEREILKQIIDKDMELQETKYCRTGLGKDLPECHRCGDLCTNKKRILNGGPDIEAQISKVGNKGTTGPVLIIPDSITTKEALSEFIQRAGFKRGTPEYWQFYKEYSQKYKSEYNQLN